MEVESISTPIAVVACASMAVLYVAILYAPTMLLRLPCASSVKDFMLRRFICAAISSILSLLLSALILLLSIRSVEVSDLLGVYGVRSDHVWQAVVFPLSLTYLMYAGSLVRKSLLLIDSCNQYIDSVGGFSFECVAYALRNLHDQAISLASNVLAWRNYVVAPITEELVFRACMIPLLICGGFKANTVIFLCPTSFSLAHLNNLKEQYTKHNNNWTKAFVAVGPQLVYTLIFGSYASFLFIRTGHILAPLVAHICCNVMGLPVVFSRSRAIGTHVGLVRLSCIVWIIFLLASLGERSTLL